MKVMALVEGPDHASYRYRIEAFAWAMAERGLELEVVPLCRSLPGRLGQLRAAGGADLVILQRKLLPVGQTILLRSVARRLVYDFDDAVSQRDSYSRKGPESNVRMARFWATVYAADAVIAGNGHLKRIASGLAEPGRVRVIPTCVEPGRYHSAQHRRRGAAARLVWIGQRSTLASLRLAAGHLAAAAGRLPGLALRTICDCSIHLPGVKAVARPWSSATEAAELAEGDIGINWLPDDSWSRGKCGLRVLQYMAAGLPVVANPVGMNRRMVVHGRTGLLASTPQEWADAIARLAADPQLRRDLGQSGRRLVQRRYSVAVWGPALAELLRRVAGGTDAGGCPGFRAKRRRLSPSGFRNSVRLAAGTDVTCGCDV